MFKYGPVKAKQVVEVTCDRCKNICVKGMCSPIGEFAELKAHWGYDSNHDTQYYNLHICETCFFELIKDFKNKEFKEML